MILGKPGQICFLQFPLDHCGDHTFPRGITWTADSLIHCLPAPAEVPGVVRPWMT